MFEIIAKSIRIVFICILLTSCNGHTNDLSGYDPFLSLVSMELREVPVVGSKTIETTAIVNPGRILRWDSDLLIVSDNARKSLVLLHVDGTELSVTGRQGRGPGEFGVINQLHKGSDDFLYVLDRMQGRVTKFEIEHNEFRYVQSFSPDTQGQKFLQEIYVTTAGFYAIYNQTVDYATGENSNYLYRTDEHFNPTELLFTMDGGEKISMAPVGFIDHPLASHTLWSQSGNNFFTLGSHHATLKKTDLESGDRSIFALIRETSRPNNSRSKSYLEERLEPVIRVVPAVSEAIQESDQLPLHHSLFVDDGWAVMTGFYSGSTDGIVLLHEIDSDRVAYAKVPPHFYPFALNGKDLIGINRPSQDQMDIKIVTLDW